MAADIIIIITIITLCVMLFFIAIHKSNHQEAIKELAEDGAKRHKIELLIHEMIYDDELRKLVFCYITKWDYYHRHIIACNQLKCCNCGKALEHAKELAKKLKIKECYSNLVEKLMEVL